ncbi:hypothetical protein RCH22_002403 [Cryobacterium psychrotolerans]|nr:hypothetical protein [Cryobacterium psychrotolerans]
MLQTPPISLATEERQILIERTNAGIHDRSRIVQGTPPAWRHVSFLEVDCTDLTVNARLVQASVNAPLSEVACTPRLSFCGDFGQRTWWFLLRCQGWLLITMVDFVGSAVAER